MKLPPVYWKPNPRARRMTLRLSVGERRIVFTYPPRLSRRKAESFLARHADWVTKAWESLPPAIPFMPGTRLMVEGEELELLQLPAGKGRLRHAEAQGQLWVAGEDTLYANRVKRWLAAEAKSRLLSRAQVVAAKIDHEVTAVRVGDFRSRWGSCNARGELAFSWRLLLAPVAVIDAVVAHEVAHLEEMNHSPAFWRLAEELLGASHQPAHRWLRANAALLHSYGAPEEG